MIICADDYGLSDDVDQAILELCSAGRLSAVSCMVALERCGVYPIQRLLAHQANVDIGLHLVLADETLPRAADAMGNSSLHFPAYGAVLRRALLGRLVPQQVLFQVSAQYELFH